MKKFIYFSLIALTFIWAFSACEKDSTGADSETGHLQLLITDSPADYDSVKITFTKISAHIDSEWIDFMVDPTTVDLLKWTNGKTKMLADVDIPAGKYTQVRIIIDEAEIGVDDKIFPLEVPSGAKTGLKFGPQFTIESGSSYELVIDFDAHRSIVVMGSKKNPKGYKLKPRIRVISKAITGSISGAVINHEYMPVIYAYTADDTVATAKPDTSSGFFRLAFLPENTYTVSIEDDSSRAYMNQNVEVITGLDTDLGEITLQ